MTMVDGPRQLCIRVEGELRQALDAELNGLIVTRLPSGTELRGQLPDATRQWSVLHRLQRAGLVLRSVERVEVPEDTSSAGECPRQGPLALVEVEGYAGSLIAASIHNMQVHQNPPSTTLAIPFTSDQELFEVLWELETLAFDVLDIHIVD
nr:hypothetical protein [Propionicimonas sp.]